MRNETQVDNRGGKLLAQPQSQRRQAGCREDANPAWVLLRAALGVMRTPPLVSVFSARALASLAANLRWSVRMSAEKSAVVVLLLTVREAAKRLGVCRRTLERLIESGEFPRPVKIRGALRVPSSDVERYVESLLRERAS